MSSCQKYVGNKQSNLTHWHPVLGWFAQYLDPQLHASLPQVRFQLSYLWRSSLASVLLRDLAPIVEAAGPPVKTNSEDPYSFKNMCKLLLSDPTKYKNPHCKLGTPDFVKVAHMAALYQTALSTLTQLRLDILTGNNYYAQL